MSLTPTQSAAIKAGLRTAEQTLTMGLGVITGGGAIVGATSLAAINWEELGGALAFVVLTALFAGIKSTLSFLTNGVPAAYTATIPAAIVIPTAQADPVPVTPADPGHPAAGTEPAAVGV